MTRVQRSKDCGNSPKNKFVEEIAIALEKGDAKTLAPVLADQFFWEAGTMSTHSHDAFMQELAKRKTKKPSSITIDNVLSHGKKGAASGLVKYPRGKQIRFCYVLEFANTKCDRVSKVAGFNFQPAGT